MLSQQIKEIGNSIVQSYKSDIDIDIEFCQKHPNSQIVWMLSETGTQVADITIPGTQRDPDNVIGFHKAIDFVRSAALSGQYQYDRYYLITTDENGNGTVEPLIASQLQLLLNEREEQVPAIKPNRSNWLQIKCPEHYQKVRQFAEDHGLLQQLEQQLNRLRDMSDRYYYQVELSEDFAPYSFFWVQYYRVDGNWKRGMHGGLIFTDFPNEMGWSIHT